MRFLLPLLFVVSLPQCHAGGGDRPKETGAQPSASTPASSTPTIPSAQRSPDRLPDMEALARAKDGVRTVSPTSATISQSARGVMCDNAAGLEKAFGVRFQVDLPG